MRRSDEKDELGFGVAVGASLGVGGGAGHGDEGAVVDEVEERRPALGDDGSSFWDQGGAEVEVWGR